MWDVAVIGAGPAGCAAAIELARAGRSVGLLEKSSFPRDKLCGEFLSPEAVGSLERLGCAAEFWRFSPARIDRALLIAPSGARLELPFPAPAWGLSRVRFDQMLARAAAAAGAELIEKAEIAKSSERVPGTPRILEARDGRLFQARSVLLAAGRHSFLQPAPASRRVWFGFKAHYQGKSAGRVELYFFRGGYCGIAPVENGRVNVCALVEKDLLRRHRGEEVLNGVPALRDRLAGLHRLERFLHTGPVVMGWRRPPADMLPAGDAALFADPFTGDGMSLALATGRLAAQHLVSEAGAGGYARELRTKFARQLRASALLRLAARFPRLEAPLLALFGNQAVQRAAFAATRVAGIESLNH